MRSGFVLVEAARFSTKGKALKLRPLESGSSSSLTNSKSELLSDVNMASNESVSSMLQSASKEMF